NLFSYGAVDWERDSDLREFIGKINLIRNQHVSLQKGTYTFLETNQGLADNTQLIAYLRQFEGELIVVVVNMDVHRTAGPAQVYLPEAFSGNYTLCDLLTNQVYDRSGQSLLVEVAPGNGHL